MLKTLIAATFPRLRAPNDGHYLPGSTTKGKNCYTLLCHSREVPDFYFITSL